VPETHDSNYEKLNVQQFLNTQRGKFMNLIKKRWYELKGLSNPHSVILEHNNHLFWSESILTDEKFNSLFDYCKNEWAEKKYCLVEFTKEADDGTPIGSMVTEISTEVPRALTGV
jgi:hypothetical protein